MVGPVDSDEQTEMRSGFTRTDDEVHPGDTIEWPVALDSGQRGREDFAVHDALDDVDPQPLEVHEGDWDGAENEICAFCQSSAKRTPVLGDDSKNRRQSNAPQHIRERGGAMKADYVLKTDFGMHIAYTCHACIAQATVVGGDA
jgi:hypothetical protein